MSLHAIEPTRPRGQRGVDGVELPRHRADAATESTSRRWRGAPREFDFAALAYLPRFVGDGEGRRPLDTKAAAPTVRQVLRAGWCLSAVCVLASTLVVLRGSLLTSDRAVQRAIARCLPLTVLNCGFHATAGRRRRGRCSRRATCDSYARRYAGLGVAVLAAHRCILARGLGLPAIWLTYFGVQFSKAIVVFPIRAGMVARPAWTRRRSALAFA